VIVAFLYALGKLRPLAGGPGKGWKLMLASTLPWLAGYVAVSRVVDYRHSRADVNAGAAIGSTCALLFYHMNFNPVWTQDCHVPRFAESSDANAVLRAPLMSTLKA
jgi:membrane-associated phospholipid phosphatase